MLKFLLASGVAAAALAAAASPAAAQSGSQFTVGEVIVTAERRVQSVQKSSLAIAVHSDAELKNAGVTQIRDLVKLEPGVQIGQGGPATQIYIRGVGDFGSTPITNPAVATHVDGIYISRANSIYGLFYDLERIEVLKGPQGTLYGRNATGGAINIITAPPKLGQSGGHLEVELGDYSLVRAEGALNVAVGDTAAIRASFQSVSREGYSAFGFDDDKEWSARLSGLWKPTDDLSLRLTVDREHQGGNGPAYVWKGPVDPSVQAILDKAGIRVPNDARQQAISPAIQQVYFASAARAGFCAPNGVIPAASATKSGVFTGPQGLCPAGFASLLNPATIAQNSGQNNDDTNVTAELNYNLDFATLTVLPGYRHVRNHYTTFPLAIFHSYGLDQDEISNTYSAEVRLGNSTPKLTWVTGVYAYREAQDAPTGATVVGEINNPGLISGSSVTYQKINTTTQAVFGQLTYSVTDPWRVIVGARYSRDSRNIAGYTAVFDTPLSFPFAAGQGCFLKPNPCASTVFGGSHKWSKVTYKLGTEYDVTPDNMLFLTYATGTKAGGFNAFAPANQQAPLYGPEKIAALELGSRNRFFERRLQVNLEGFYWKYRDAHETVASLDSGGAIRFGTTNAARATMYGVDTSVVAQLSANDTVQFAVELLHTNFDSFRYNGFNVLALATGCVLTPGTATNPLQTIDCSGKPLTRSPEVSGTLGYTHVFELANGGTVDAAFTGQFATKRELTVDYIASTRANGYYTGDVTVTYHSPDKKWSVAGYVRNINDELIYTGGFTAEFALPSYTVGNLAPPRTFGVRVAVDF